MGGITTACVPDRELLKRCRLFSSRCKVGERAELWELIDAWEVAVKLTSGPDAGRSKHWRREMKKLESRLAVFIETRGDQRL